MVEVKEFEEALDTLIQLKLTKANEEQIKEHFGSVALYEHIKLILWGIK